MLLKGKNDLHLVVFYKLNGAKTQNNSKNNLLSSGCDAKWVRLRVNYCLRYKFSMRVKVVKMVIAYI